MATTSKPRRKKAKSNNEKKVLNSLELQDLRQLENLSKDVQNAKLEMALEEQSQKNMSLELILLQHNIEKQRQIVMAKAERFENKKEIYKKYVKEISPKYGFKDGETLGYKPETGDIIR